MIRINIAGLNVTVFTLPWVQARELRELNDDGELCQKRSIIVHIFSAQKKSQNYDQSPSTKKLA